MLALWCPKQLNVRNLPDNNPSTNQTRAKMIRSPEMKEACRHWVPELWPCWGTSTSECQSQIWLVLTTRSTRKCRLTMDNLRLQSWWSWTTHKDVQPTVGTQIACDVSSSVSSTFLFMIHFPTTAGIAWFLFSTQSINCRSYLAFYGISLCYNLEGRIIVFVTIICDWQNKSL